MFRSTKDDLVLDHFGLGLDVGGMQIPLMEMQCLTPPQALDQGKQT